VPEQVEAGRYVEASALGMERRIGILDSSLFNLPDGGSRRTHRTRSVILTEPERDRLREMALRASRCGTRWAAFRGMEFGNGPDAELRLCCQLRCGTRACARCAKEIREREADRVVGPWQLFFTFTVPRGRASTGDMWREVHLWVAALVREMRRETRIATITDAENDEIQKPYSNARRQLARSRVRASGTMTYAWVLEPHKDGAPHVHMVTDQSYVDFAWLRELWASCCGVMSAWVYGERVYQAGGACAYLCKYISKARLPMDVLALLYRRRMWATNMERPERPEPVWFLEENVSSDEARRDAEAGDDMAPESGWKLVSAKDNGYAMWRREIDGEEGYDWTLSMMRQAGREASGDDDGVFEAKAAWNRSAMNARYGGRMEAWFEALAYQRSLTGAR
jgi:hypothetical protein